MNLNSSSSTEQSESRCQVEEFYNSIYLIDCDLGTRETHVIVADDRGAEAISDLYGCIFGRLP